MVSRWASNSCKIGALMQASRIVWVKEIGHQGDKILCLFRSRNKIWTYCTQWKRKINSSICEEVQLKRKTSLCRPTKATTDQLRQTRRLRMLQERRYQHLIKSLLTLIRSAMAPKYTPNCNWKVKTNSTREEQASTRRTRITVIKRRKN